MNPPSTPQSLLDKTWQDHNAAITQFRKELQSTSIPQCPSNDTEEQLKRISSTIIRTHVPTFFGFVIGGVTPMAHLADNYVSKIDANVGTQPSDTSIAADIEDTALRWLLEMFKLDPTEWPHRIFTTGAAASNILGIAMGRDWVVQEAAKRQALPPLAISEIGIFEALTTLGKKGIRILSTLPHSSLLKAASVIGIGRKSCIDVIQNGTVLDMDLDQIELHLAQTDFLHIVAISFSEINTGLFATNEKEFTQISKLCKKYGSWLHVDGAFGVFARILENEDLIDANYFIDRTNGLELADSITGDGHKLLNVPYDCGFFFSKHIDIAKSVFQNVGAAYLKTTAIAGAPVPSLNIGLENSRRFRALPVYATLRAYGVQGYRDMLVRQIKVSREIASAIESHEAYELLPSTKEQQKIFMIVLFRAKDLDFNKILVQSLNQTGIIWVSGTGWEDKPAARIAVANWQVTESKQSTTVRNLLDRVWRSFTNGRS